MKAIFTKSRTGAVSFFTLVLLSIVLFTGTAAQAMAAESRPWYASGLEALGFFVFDKPLEQPNFTVSALAGGLKSRASAKGNIMLLNFWATWCPPCKREIPTIEKLYQTMKGEKFEIMAISLGEPLTTVKSFVANNNINFPVYLDPKNQLAATYASRGIPTTYILDKDGRFIAGIIGAFEYDNPQFIKIIQELARK